MSTTPIVSIFLGDLVHNFRGRGPFTMPLNLGAVTAYVKKYYQGQADLNFRLFKFPEEMIRAVRETPPNIIGLGSYTWNEQLNLEILRLCREEFPSIVQLMAKGKGVGRPLIGN